MAKLVSAQNQRLLSLDTYRGLVMFVLASGGFGIVRAARAAEKNGGAFSEVLDFLTFYVTHPKWDNNFYWVGFSPWDMIQPAFMFIVGVSMPYSYAKRKVLGHSFAQRARHAWSRALILTLLGVFLQSQSQRYSDTNWLFTNVLSQIGLGYGFLFFLVGKSFRIQLITGSLVLFFYWLLFVLYPSPDKWGFNANAATAFDRWFLNLFPRPEVYDGHRAGYCTLNFIPSFVTMLMGVMCGQLLKTDGFQPARKLTKLGVAGLICLIISLILDATVCPIIKVIWTPSWTLFSGAYVIWLLAIMYWVVDLKGWQRWTFPFVVVGLNPLTMYFLGQLNKGWMSRQLKTHLPDFLFQGAHGEIVLASFIVAIFWLVLYWMYRNKVFIRI